MKRFFIVISLIICLFCFSSCQKENTYNEYEEYAGVYELYYTKGYLKMEMFEYYRITLTADGKYSVELKVSETQEVYTSEGSYKIFQVTITFNPNSIIPETYTYVNGEIHMYDVEINGFDDYKYTAKFRRNS